MRHFKGVPVLIQNTQNKFPSTQPAKDHQKLQQINHKPTKSRYIIPTNTITSIHQRDYTLK